MVLHSDDKRCETIGKDKEMGDLYVFLVTRVAIIRTVVLNEETMNDNKYPGTRCLLLIQVCGQGDFQHAHEACPHHDNQTVSLPLVMRVILRWDSS